MPDLDFATQERFYVAQLKIARDYDLPVLLHCRRANDQILKHLAKALPAVPRVYLVGGENVSRIDSAEKVKEVAAWATGLGPNKMIVAKVPDVVKWARAANLTVTPWTFRSSNTGTFASVKAEMEEFLYKHDVDALFTDNPDQFPRK